MKSMFISHGILVILAALSQLVCIVAGIITALRFFNILGGEYMPALITTIAALVFSGIISIAAFANLTFGAAREFRL